MPSLSGASINASGTKVAAAKALGGHTLDTTKASKDVTTLVPHGNLQITVKSALDMGLLQRDSAGTLSELNGPATPTRVG